MESALRGVVLDSSVLVAAERKKLTTPEAIRNIRQTTGNVPIVVCALTVAELGHGIYRANTPERAQQRRQFLDELKAHIPIHAVTDGTAEIIARVGGELAARGVNLPLADLIIGASALELGYAIATHNVRHFAMIPNPYKTALGGRAPLRPFCPSFKSTPNGAMLIQGAVP
jgi:predicted nucleic acid-binding protein